MPRRDRTGPEGLGPMTGRAMGYCNPNSRDIGLRRFFGRSGFGRRSSGRGRAFRRRFLSDYYPENFEPYGRISKEEEKKIIEEEISVMKEDIDYMTKRLEELGKSTEKKNDE